MKAALAELRDPSGLLLALITAVLARVVQPNFLVALASGLAVLVVKSLSAGLLIGRRRPVSQAPLYGLTRRELEVAQYVGLGFSNKEIATRLGGRSERTVDNHVQHILTKLEFRSRSQIAAWAAERGLLSKDRNEPEIGTS